MLTSRTRTTSQTDEALKVPEDTGQVDVTASKGESPEQGLCVSAGFCVCGVTACACCGTSPVSSFASGTKEWVQSRFAGTNESGTEGPEVEVRVLSGTEGHVSEQQGKAHCDGGG